MERSPRTDPVTHFVTQQFRMQSSAELQEYEKSILRSPPPGFRNFIRWVDEDRFEFGVEAVAAVTIVGTAVVAEVKGGEVIVEPGIASAVVADGLEGKTDKELQSIMGLKGIKYDKKNFIRGDAIARIRAAAPAQTGGGTG